MAFSRFATVAILIGFIGIQHGSCTISPISTNYQTTTTTEEVVETVSVQQSTRATTLPIYPDGSLCYYDQRGLPRYTMNYPFYSPFSHKISTDILSDHDVNMQLAKYSYMYNIPSTSLLQMYDLINSIMPTLPVQSELNMLQAMAEAYQAERMGYITNYKHPQLDKLYIDQLMNYLPGDYPPAYRNMMAHLDSRVPSLSAATSGSIQRAIYDNVTPALQNRAEYLSFAASSSMRYMLFSQMSWSIMY